MNTDTNAHRRPKVPIVCIDIDGTIWLGPEVPYAVAAVEFPRTLVDSYKRAKAMPGRETEAVANRRYEWARESRGGRQVYREVRPW
jgi:hypothetical protein